MGNNIHVQSILTNKYDAALDYPITMYDNLPYQRDSEFCGSNQIRLNSNQLIKYYLCLNEQEAYKVNNRDDEIQGILDKQRISAQAEVITQNNTFEDDETSGISQEQIQTLLDDIDDDSISSDNFDDSGIDLSPTEDEIPANAVNAFDGVEDW